MWSAGMVLGVQSEEDFPRAIQHGERQSRAAGDQFADTCAAGDPALLFAAADELNLTCDGWRHAFLSVKPLKCVQPAIRQAFLTIWIESKYLALTAGDHRAVADALRVLM